MNSSMSRAEALSLMAAPQLAPSQLDGDPVIDIRIAENQDIVVVFAKSGERRIPRAANQVPQSSVVWVTVAGYNPAHELIVGLSNGEVYNLGNLTGPENYTGASGVGIFAGLVNGHPTFKPLIGGGDVVVEPDGITITGSIDPDQSFNSYARFYELLRYTNTPPANTWHMRSIREMMGSLPGVSLNNNLITLPPGTYYAQGWCVSYRTNTLCSRLFDVTGNRVLIRGMPCSARVGSGYNAETYSRFGGQFVLTQTTQLQLQAFVSNPFSEHSITPNGNQVEIWRLK